MRRACVRPFGLRTWGLLVVPIVLTVLLGCAEPPPTPQLARQSLGFLAAGKTTREQVVIKFGIPSYAFEKERILTYRMTWTKDRGLHAISYDPFQRHRYHLVLVFDEAGVLKRWTLLEK